MKRADLAQAIAQKKSFLCVGLDSDINRIPAHLQGSADSVFEFNKAIIDATHEYCVSYKINTAFYESRGVKGWETLEKTLNYIPKGIFTIADAKRGDIGNTAKEYAKTFFETLPFDSVTLSPYMGEDTIRPFLEYDDKWTILLGLTSNPGARDFQMLKTEEGRELYKVVLEKAATWGTPDQLMFVAGATRPEMIGEIRGMLPEYFLLVPGIGAQGGSLEQTSQYGLTSFGGLLVNSSRDIIFASGGEDFAEAAAKRAKEVAAEMAGLLGKRDS